MKKILSLAAILPMLQLGAVAAHAATVDLEVTNSTHNIYFTPLLITAHPDSVHLFRVGSLASAGLQAMAEGGDTSGLLAAAGGADADTIDNPAAGLLGPGQSTATTLVTTDPGNTRLSLVAMMLPTNDGFVGMDSLGIPTSPGTYTYYLNGYDAGTEANDELLNTLDGGVPGTAGIPGDPTGAAGSGGSGVAVVDSNTSVHIHRGTLGDSDPSGGDSDLSSSSHRWLNPVAVIRLTVQ
jgi:hypothetical protein